MSSKQIQKIVLLCAHHQNEAPEFLELLSVLVKVEGLDMTIKRNQALVMKYIMQNYRKAAYVLDQPRDQRYLSNWDNRIMIPLSLCINNSLKKYVIRIKIQIKYVYQIHFSGSLF